MLDNLIISFDRVLNILFTPKCESNRDYPDENISNRVELTEDEKDTVIKLLRVNYCGEVCAQGLYQGQRMFIGSKKLDKELAQAAIEEQEHLAWLDRRLTSLGGHKSVFNPVFYTLSITCGALASLAGSGYNMGFLYETERQVEDHLIKHLKLLPENDLKTSAILQQMQLDESNHATHALELGAKKLPKLVSLSMLVFSKVMTTSTAII